MLTQSSRGVLAFSALLALTGAGLGDLGGWDPFIRPAPEEPEAAPTPMTVTKRIVRPTDSPVDERWAQAVKEFVARRDDALACGDPRFRGVAFSVPAIIDVDSEGHVQSVRLGLFEATAVGVCVEHQLRRLTVPPPPASSGRGLIVEMPVSRASQETLTIDPTVLGSLSTDAVRSVLDEHRQQVRYCHEMLLNRFPLLSGAVTVKFVVGASGAVASAAVTQSTVNNLELDSCVIGRVKSWVFPMPRGGGVAIVTHRFVFGEQR